mmetsp:Transcript_7912/g.23311  ORF Transcript_7912/g.23311 Transcript_7912/m.23311 type:complete len:324 (+) Transcript_7912:64-1035(+)
MYDYNNDPRGLRKKKLRWRVLAQQYGGVAAGVAIFLLVCALVALAGNVKHWKGHAQQHEVSHRVLRASHSALETALQLKEREVKERHEKHEAVSKQVQELEHHLEAERRHKAGTESELQAAKRELAEYKDLAEGTSLELETAHHQLDLRHEQLLKEQAATEAARKEAADQLASAEARHRDLVTLQHKVDALQMDLDTCLHSVSSHSSTRAEVDKDVAELRERVAKHENRELQLMKEGKALEQALLQARAAATAAIGAGAQVSQTADIPVVAGEPVQVHPVSPQIPAAPQVPAAPKVPDAPKPAQPLDLVRELAEGRRIPDAPQ